MKEFPRTTVAGVSLPRMIIGTNWMLGYSHRTASADAMIRQRYASREAVCDTVSAYLSYGIDAMMAPFVSDDLTVKSVLMDGIHMAEQKMGRPVILIDTPTFHVEDTPEARDYTARKLELCAKNGATFCLLHHSSVEKLVRKSTGEIERLEEYTAMVRRFGMIPGLSAHMPELIVYSDAHPEYDVQTYIQIYNCMGFLMQVEVESVRRIIERAQHPVMTIKAMAAGRCTPYVGLSFSYATLREQDMVVVGAYTPQEVHEDVEIALAALEHRFPDMERRNSPNITTVLK